MRLFRFLSRHAAWVLFAGVFVGLAAPDWASALRPLLGPSVAGLLLISALRVRSSELAAALSRPARMGAVVGWVLFASPVLTWFAVLPTPLSYEIKLALLLMAATPPLFSSPAMALLWGLDAPLMLAVVVLCTVAGPFTLVAVTGALTGFELDFSPVALMVNLCLMVGGCFALGFAGRAILGGARIERAAPALDTAVIVLLLLFAVGVMDGVSDRYRADPGFVWQCLAVAFAAYVLLQAAGALAASWLGLKSALTVAFATGNRAMGLLLAVAPSGMHEDVLLYFAIGQLPMYLMPAVLAPMYRRLLAGHAGHASQART